mmetsp:Transcript_32329/g.41545  ORF Transcript_32329/g.41545 Transcript_32329/m.41545 type:complete len:349 (+) Transcript_32329:127-1173(+)
MIPVLVAMMLVGLTFYLLFGQQKKTQNDQKKSTTMKPRVFVSSGENDHVPIKTGTSLVGLLSSEPHKYQTDRGGHVINGILATELDDFSIVLSTTKTTYENVLWQSGFLTLGNTAPWHKCDFNGIPRKYEYCKAAACVLILDDQGHVLITRRCKHMRTFPRAWVCPGGGMDDGESLAECAAREVREETGLVITVNELKPLTLFESFFPTSPDDIQKKGRVSGQYLVCFFTITIKGHNPKITLQREEANAYAWIPSNALDLPHHHEVSVFERSSSSTSSSTSSTSSSTSSTSSVVVQEVENGFSEVKYTIRELMKRYDSKDGDEANGCAEAHLFSIKQYQEILSSNQNQ